MCKKTWKTKATTTKKPTTTPFLRSDRNLLERYPILQSMTQDFIGTQGVDHFPVFSCYKKKRVYFPDQVVDQEIILPNLLPFWWCCVPFSLF